MGDSDDRISRSLSIYQALLWLFPVDFRDAYGRLMLQAFQDQLRDTASLSDRLTLWFRTIVDVFMNALEEHMQKNMGLFRSFLQPSPGDKPLRWLILFCLLTLAAFYLYRLMVMTISIDLVDLLLERTALEVGNPILRILRHGYLHSVVFSVLLAGFQAFLFKQTAISPVRWFLASFVSWTLGMIVASQIWTWVGPDLSPLLWSLSPSLVAHASVITQSLVLGLIVGVAQLWAVWKHVRLYALWPVITLAAAAVQYGAFEIILRRPEVNAILIFIPYLAYGLLTGLALVLLLSGEVQRPETGSVQETSPPEMSV